MPGAQTRLADHGRARHDSVVVLWVLLRLHEPLPTACRAPVEVRQLCRLAIECRNNRLRTYCHFVNGTVRKVIELFRMTYRKERIAAPARMARVGRCRCIPLVQCLCHCPVADE